MNKLYMEARLARIEGLASGLQAIKDKTAFNKQGIINGLETIEIIAIDLRKHMEDGK